MVKILFVCLGNICRSPMAEAVMRHKIVSGGFSDDIEVDSSGTSNYHIGAPPHIGTRNKLDECGISYDGIFARQITRQDFDDFDYIIVMDSENYKDCKKVAGQSTHSKIYLLADFVDGETFECGKNVPDPWHTGDFDLTYELMELGCEALLSKILENEK